MTSSVRESMMKIMLIISVICLVGSLILFTLNPPGSIGRTAMILLGITSLSTGVSFYLQYRQGKQKH
jgi:uncharacterized membrane protein